VDACFGIYPLDPEFFQKNHKIYCNHVIREWGLLNLTLVIEKTETCAPKKYETCDMWHCCKRSLFWARKQSNGLPFSWSAFFLQMLLWPHCSSFGASRRDSQHGRMCLSKMCCYYLYAGFGTAWVPETTVGISVQTKMNQIQHHIGAWKQEIYWRHKGGIQKIEKMIGLCFCLDHQMICWSFHVALVDYSRTFILDGSQHS